MMNASSVDWRVYAIVDADGDDPVGLTQRLLDASVGVVQLRDKRGDVRQTLQLARKLRELCAAHSTCFIINDRVDIALAVGADGVHVGPNDLPVDVVRKIAPNLIVGASAGTAEDALRAQAAGAHYLGSGAVFDASASKPDAHHNRGLKALASVVNAVEIPVVGIGGVTPENAAEVRSTGASGVAVIRALAASDDVLTTVAQLRG